MKNLKTALFIFLFWGFHSTYATDRKLSSRIGEVPVINENSNIKMPVAGKNPINNNDGNIDLSIKMAKASMSKLAAEAIGVNTHLNFMGTVYDVHYEDIIKPRLVELGTKHIRDHFGNEKINSRFVELAHAYDIKLLILNNDVGNDMADTKAEVKRLNQINPDKPVVDLIEAANERDNGWKQDWTKLGDYIHSFWKIYKEDPQTVSIPLVGPSFANTRESAIHLAENCKNASQTMDLGNLHAYSGLFPESPIAGGWGISFAKAIESYRSLCGDKPIIETESGYKNSEGMDGHPAVSERTAAKYSLRLILNRLNAGIQKLYFYQLINDVEDFGLLNSDGTPRLQYTALKNFIHLMADEGDDFVTGNLSYGLSGELVDIHQMLFQKRNGNFMLVIWQGINGSANGTQNNDYVDINNPDKKITLKLEQKASIVNVYRPSFDKVPDGNGINPIRTLENTSVIDLSVPDHLVIVEIGFNN